ncbi:MAG: NAD(P)H-dependent oxidoreductase [Alphaproteobacteria bacterium]
MSKTLLLVTASPMGEASTSTKLAESYLKRWQDTHPDGHVIRRDVGTAPPPHLDQTILGAFFTPEDERSEEQKQATALSDELIAELTSADEIVFAVPMHNFTISSGLKTWVDHIARAGLTFRYTETGPQGLLADRPVRLIASRGGNYEGSPIDFQVPYLVQIMNFIGITSVTTITAEGTAMGQDGIAQAEATLNELDLAA